MHTLPLPEYKTAAAKKPKWVFSHYGYFKNLWDVVILLATIYVAIIVPYNAAFHGTRYDQGRNGTIYCLRVTGCVNRYSAQPEELITKFQQVTDSIVVYFVQNCFIVSQLIFSEYTTKVKIIAHNKQISIP